MKDLAPELKDKFNEVLLEHPLPWVVDSLEGILDADNIEVQIDYISDREFLECVTHCVNHFQNLRDHFIEVVNQLRRFVPDVNSDAVYQELIDKTEFK